MACSQELLELMSCYVDGEATPEEAARAEAHLDSCAECRETVQEWRHGIEMLDWTYARALPEDVAEPTFDAPMPAPERVQRRWTFAMRDMRILTAAAALILIAVVSAYVYQTVISLPTLGRSLATAQRAQTVLVAAGIRLEIEPDSEITRLGDKAIRLVQGTVNAQVIHGRGFRIQTRKLEIIDEGTRFQVHSDPNTDSVTVKEGRVLVHEGKDEYHVGAGETLTSTGDQHHNETRLQRNGKDNTPSQPRGGVAFGSIPTWILGILLLTFWVRMLVNALTREFRDTGRKIGWVPMILLGIGFGQLLEAIVYYISGQRITWVQGILFSQLLAAIIYYVAVYRKDHPQERFRHLLVGRKGNQRVIKWWDVLDAAVISAAAFSYGSALVAHEASAATLFVGVTVGIMFVVACVVQVLSYPLDVLTDLETGERPSQEVRNKRYPLPLLVARRNGRRVVMWANIGMLAAIATGVFSVFASSFSQSSNPGGLLHMAVRVFLGLFVLIVVSSLEVRLNKPSKLDDEGFNPNAPVRITILTLAARKGGKRVILWRNVPLIMLCWVLACGLWFGMVRFLFPELKIPPVWIVFGVISGLGVIGRALSIPLDKLPILDDDPPARRRRPPRLPLVGRRGDRRVILWWNVLRMALFFYVFIAGGSEIAHRAIRGTWREELLYFGLLAVAMNLAISINRLLRAPLDELPSLDDDPPNQ